jgi:hypothetical protein
VINKKYFLNGMKATRDGYLLRLCMLHKIHQKYNKSLWCIYLL